MGFGIQAQYNEYGLAVTSHGGKAVFTLTLNLLDRISKLNETWAERLRRP